MQRFARLCIYRYKYVIYFFKLFYINFIFFFMNNQVNKNPFVKPKKMPGANLKVTAATVASLCIVCTVLLAMLLSGCDKSVSEPKDSKLGPLQKVLDGYMVKAIAFDSKGNAWIGTFHQGIIRYNAKETVIYNSENSIIPENFYVWDIAIDKNDNVWIGGSAENGHGGLLKYDGREFTLYNSQNSAMPLDFAKNVVVDSKNNVWFSSCNYNTGGIVKYDGNEWTVYTPDNSDLPYNLENSMMIDQSDNVWVAYHNQLVRISNNGWKIYSEKELGFAPYNISDIQFNSKNYIVGALDYSLSSLGDHSSSPSAFVFDGNNKASLFYDTFRGFPKLFIDHKDNIWCFGIMSDCVLLVGKQWKKIVDFNGEYSGGGVWTMNEHADRRIWFGTEDGIYISDKEPLNH